MHLSQLKLICAMALWGTMAIFVKNIPLAPIEIAFYRSSIAVITLILLRMFTHQSIDWQACRKDWLGLSLSGAALGLNWTMLFSAYHYVSVSIATFCYYLAPTIILLFSTLLFHEVMNKRVWFYLILSSLGLLLILNPQALSQQNHLVKGVLFGLCAAFFYAMVMISNKILHHTNGLDRTIIQLTIASLFLFPFCLSHGLHLQSLSIQALLNLLILGIVYTALAYTLFFSAIHQLPSIKVALMTYIDPLTALLTSTFILHETLLINQIIGGLFILASAILNELNQS